MIHFSNYLGISASVTGQLGPNCCYLRKEEIRKLNTETKHSILFSQVWGSVPRTVRKAMQSTSCY